MNKSKCCVCGKEEDESIGEDGFVKVELRPYGPGGQDICFDCAMSPRHKKQTERQFDALLAGCGPAVVLTKDGPLPLSATILGDIDGKH